MRSLAAAVPHHDDIESHCRALLECERSGGDALALCADLAARGWWRPVWERAERLVCSSSWIEEERRTVVRVDDHMVVIDDIEPVFAGAVIDASGRPRADAQVGITIAHGGAQVKPGDVVVIGATRTDPALAREAANTVRLLAPYAFGDCAGSYPPCECPVCYPRTQRADVPEPPVPFAAVERLYLRAVDAWWPTVGRLWLELPLEDREEPFPQLPELDSYQRVDLGSRLQQLGAGRMLRGLSNAVEVREGDDALTVSRREALRSARALERELAVQRAVTPRQRRVPRAPREQARQSVEHLRSKQRRRGRW